MESQRVSHLVSPVSEQDEVELGPGCTWKRPPKTVQPTPI